MDNKLNKLLYWMRCEKLYLKAKKRWAGQHIDPCSGRTMADCFTEYDGALMFWYNIGVNTFMEKEAQGDG